MSRFNDAFRLYGSRIAAALAQDPSSAGAFNNFAVKAGNDGDNNGNGDSAGGSKTLFTDAMRALWHPAAGRDAAGAKALFAAFAHLTDPTASQPSPWKYLDWTCRAYLQDASVATEDLYKIADTLRDFAAFAPLMDNKVAAGRKTSPRSIEHYPTLEALRAALRPMAQKRDRRKTAEARRRMDADKMNRILNETSMVYQGPEGKIVVPHTVESCIFWGQQTKWCVSAEKSRNFFGQYNDKAPLWIYLPKATARERDLFKSYDSFKFAGTQGRLYDENDKDPDFLPPSLHRLIRAAVAHAPAHMARHLNRHGGYRRFGILPRYRLFPLPADPGQWQAKAVLKVLKKYRESYSADMSDILALVPEHLKHDGDFMLKAARHDLRGVIKILPPGLLANNDFTRRAIGLGIPVLAIGPEDLRNDREIVALACARTGAEISHVGGTLLADRDFMLSLVRANGDIYSRLDEGRRNDRDFVLAALRSEKPQHISHFRDLPPALQDDTDILAAFAARSEYMYECMTPRQKKNRAIALAAIGLSNSAAREMPRAFMADEDIVLAGLRNKSANDSLLPLIDPSLFARRETVLAFVQAAGDVLSVLPPHMKADRDIVTAAVRAAPHALRFADDAFKDDDAVVRLAVAANGDALKYASQRLRCDRGMVRLALRTYPAARTYTSLELRLDRMLGLQGFLLRRWDKAVRDPLRDRALPALKQHFNNAAAAAGIPAAAPEAPKPD